MSNQSYWYFQISVNLWKYQLSIFRLLVTLYMFTVFLEMFSSLSFYKLMLQLPQISVSKGSPRSCFFNNFFFCFCISIIFWCLLRLCFWPIFLVNFDALLKQSYHLHNDHSQVYVLRTSLHPWSLDPKIQLSTWHLLAPQSHWPY